MDDTIETLQTIPTSNGPDLSFSPSDDHVAALFQLHIQNDVFLAELAYFQREIAVVEEKLGVVEREKEEVLKANLDLSKRIEKVERERDSIRVYLEEREDGFEQKMEEIRKEMEVSRERIEESEKDRRERVRVFSENFSSIRTVKECLVRVIDILNEEKLGNFDAEEEDGMYAELEVNEELKAFSAEVTKISKLASVAETKVSEYKEVRKKEKRELENSVVSLTEENRDINSILRIALVEKEAVEKSLNRLKGNSEQKRVALLQIAERGLQKVGFGFMMGTASSEQSLDNLGASTGSTKSDSSECEEEVVSLASTVEKIMKNLRLEITQLRRSLEESRSDNERLQSLAEKQAQTITENTLYIKELEDRERVLVQNIDELLMEMKVTEEEVARWREACELEVEAGKNVIEERDKVAAILQQELEKMKAALEMSNSKLKLKEELAAAAMAAQAAAERSLQLADSRAAGLRDRIEELTRQLEEAESKERGRHRVRHICWPWRALKVNPATSTNARVPNIRQMLPEMQALLHSV